MEARPILKDHRSAVPDHQDYGPPSDVERQPSNSSVCADVGHEVHHGPY